MPLGNALADYKLIRTTLENRLGNDVASLLAEPVVTSDGAHIDWYAPGTVAPRPLTALPAEQQAAIESQLADYRQQVEGLVAELRKSRDQFDLRMADSLGSIFANPDAAHHYVAEGKPLMAGWSVMPAQGEVWRPGPTAPVRPPVERPAAVPDGTPTHQPTVVFKDEASFAPQSIPLSATRTIVTRRAGLAWWGWLLWLLFALLILAIFALLLRACALAPYVGWLGLGSHCNNSQSTGELAGLQAIAADIETQLRMTGGDCTTLEPPADQPDAVSQAEERTRDLRRGDLEIALIWQTIDDLDLHLNFNCAATGLDTSIGFSQRGENVCGGVLDQDANVREQSERPAEHIVWTDAASIPPGVMNVIVNYYKDNGPASPQIPYQVVIKRGDQTPQVIDGIARAGEAAVVTQLQN